MHRERLLRKRVSSAKPVKPELTIAAAYREVLRLLKPGGLFVCIEMSRPESAIVRAANAAYVRLLMPMLARFRGGDLEAYRYLAASTGRFPRAAALAAEWQEAGFEGVRHESLMAGAIAIHVGRKGA